MDETQVKFGLRTSYFENQQYIYLIYKQLVDDDEIANFLNLSLIDYRNFLIKNFNAYICNKDTFFRNEEDASRALEWANSGLIMHELNQ